MGCKVLTPLCCIMVRFMKINYQKTEAFAEQLGVIYNVLEEQREILKSERIRLSRNSGLDSVIYSIKCTEDNIDSRLLSILQMQKAMSKISSLYKNGEDKIVFTMDSGWQIEKQSFSQSSQILISPGLRWSVI